MRGDIVSNNYITPIMDRTISDVNYAKVVQSETTVNLKGCWNYNDANRVENNCSYLYDVLYSQGYPISLNLKLNWVMSDLPSLTEITRIRNNVIKLCRVYLASGQTPTINITQFLDYQDANDLEISLEHIRIVVEDMMANYLQSGTIYAGEVY